MTLRHALLPDGVVLVFGSHERVVSFSEAKRFAWAILADLDPEEAEACGLPAPPVATRAAADSDEPGERYYGSRRLAYLGSLTSGPKRAREVAETVCEDTGVINARLAHLHALGLVARVSGGGKGTKVTWGLTEAGRAALGERRP